MEKERIWCLDCLRVLSMLGVIAFHVSKTALTDFSPSSFEAALFLSVRNVVHFVVPVFFMISGALLLNPRKIITVEYLCKRYLIKYFIILLLFGGGFSCLEQIFITKTVTIKSILNGINNMIYGESWAHMWYMYALLWVMMLLPILRAAAEKFQTNEIRYTIIVGIVFISVVGIINAYSGRQIGITYPINFIYCFYMFIGYWIYNQFFNINIKLCRIILGIVVVVLIFFGFIDTYGIVNCEMWIGNSSPLIVIYSVVMFRLGGLLRKKDNPVCNRIINELSKNSFPIYLIHMFWVNVLYKVVKFNPFFVTPVIGFISAYIIVLIFSYMSAVIIRRMPIIKMLF